MGGWLGGGGCLIVVGGVLVVVRVFNFWVCDIASPTRRPVAGLHNTYDRETLKQVV